MEGVVGYYNEKAEFSDAIKAKRGDKQAFVRLINENRLSMYRVSKSILKNEHDVEDAVSNAILKSYENITNLRKIETFKHWLLRILINECYLIIRKKKNETVAFQLTADMEGTYVDDYPDFELLKAVNSLDDEQRIVTILFYYEDMCLKDIAKSLNLPIGTVKSRLSRARENLRGKVKL